MATDDEIARAARIAVMQEKINHLEVSMTSVAAKVDEMHELLMQAKGARWAVLGLASIGGFLAGVSHKLFPFLAR